MATPPPPFRVSSERSDDTAQITVEGDLDMASAPDLSAAVDAALHAMPRRLAIDLSELQFVDSSGLRLLIAIARRAAELGVELSLVPPHEPAFSVFRVSGADERLPFVDG